MVESLGSKQNIIDLQRLPLPIWDGNCRSHATWKKEFHQWMMKYGHEKEEQL